MTLEISRFNRQFFASDQTFSVIGGGELGGKASGLAFFKEKVISRLDAAPFADVSVAVPTLTVLTTELFDSFMKRNGLYDVATSELPDARLALAFQKADFPAEYIGDLRALIAGVHSPLAVRSSSLLEDALERPFAGVYATKMTPNNQPDMDARFHKLVEAIKFVYASTYFVEAKSYRKAINTPEESEKMAVIIQEVVGRRCGTRFYPSVSGVARSYNFYPVGHARPEDGVVDLALGLGKTIVDGEAAWSYSPAFPKAPPPYNSISDLLKHTQTGFWAVNMGKPPAYDPLRETEYMVRSSLVDAEADGSLRFVASTFDPQSNRISAGIAQRGPRVLNFAPILVHNWIPLNALVRKLLSICEDAVGAPVEIEFAVTLDPRSGTPARLGFLQMRPLALSHVSVEITDEETASPNVVISSRLVLGNGIRDDIVDVVYVKQEGFDPGATPAVAAEVGAVNARLLDVARPYVLAGFGRWGTSDPWGGIPVNWGQVCGAKVIVEASMAGLSGELSQGSHFFHNLTSFHVLYFSLRNQPGHRIDWQWLASQPAAAETAHLRHIRLTQPLLVKVDGRTGRGLILRPPL